VDGLAGHGIDRTDRHHRYVNTIRHGVVVFKPSSIGKLIRSRG
jgi:hypothetical protein